MAHRPHHVWRRSDQELSGTIQGYGLLPRAIGSSCGRARTHVEGGRSMESGKWVGLALMQLLMVVARYGLILRRAATGAAAPPTRAACAASKPAFKACSWPSHKVPVHRLSKPVATVSSAASMSP
jgi:hypothetical protein